LDSINVNSNEAIGLPTQVENDRTKTAVPLEQQLQAMREKGVQLECEQ